MQPLISALLPLLGQQRIDPSGFAVEMAHGPDAAHLAPGLIVCPVILAIAVSVALFFRKVKPSTTNDGKLLFSELCCSNHLSGRQQKLLLELARSKQVSCPSHMLIDASLWTSDGSQPQHSDSAKIQNELARLRSLLFTHSVEVKNPPA